MPLFDLPAYLNLAVLPIDTWPGTPTPAGKRKRSAFSAPPASTYRTLQTELDAVGAVDRALYVPVESLQFRRDGRPMANAKLTGVGMVLEFQFHRDDDRHEVQQYAVDQFLTWQENLRAIALVLESLRRVNRFMPNTQQQYRGFLALEPGTGTDPDMIPPGVFTGLRAARWLRIRFNLDDPRMHPRDVLRAAQRAAHPDTGGDAELFGLVQEAERALRRDEFL